MNRHAQRAARPWGAAAGVGAVATVLAVAGTAWALGARGDADGARTPGPSAALASSTSQEPSAAPERPVVPLGWPGVRSAAAAELGAAAQLLEATAGQVDDEAVRAAVDAAAQDLRSAVEAAPPVPGPELVAGVGARVGALRAATAQLTAAHDSWTAAREAEAAAAAAAAAAARWVGTPDCGVPGPEGMPERTAAGTLYTSVPTDTGDGTNGNLPRSAMSPLAWCVDSQGHEQWLRADAAGALTSLNEAFRARFGENIAVDLSYRSYADQVRAKEIFGSLAATPGTSNHGLGTAIDTWESDYYDFGSDRYTWLVAHGPDYGWVCPAATERGNSEYWHFEYRG